MKVKCLNKKCMDSNGGKSYEWEYNGTNPFYASCPRCRTSVKLKGDPNPAKKQGDRSRNKK